jgi:Domain of unknown function (DUF5658)
MSDLSPAQNSTDALTPAPSVKTERRAGKWQFILGGRFLCRRAAEKEALILGAICMLDMYTTLFWVLRGDATEANPLLSWTFERHSVVFVLIKSASCVPALLLAPKLAQTQPKFTVWLLRGVIVFYLYYYFTHVK